MFKIHLPSWSAVGLTGLCLLWVGMRLHAQADAWILGNEHLILSQAYTTHSLPIHPPGTPNAYIGQAPVKSHHIRTTGDGTILFFVVDGNVYDGNGYLIADARPWNCVPLPGWPPCCEQCVEPGFMEFLSLPVPGRCDLFYLLSAVSPQGPNTGLGTAYIQWSILDMGSDNPRFAPLDPGTCGPRNGRLVHVDDLDAVMPDFDQVLLLESGPQPTSEHVFQLPSDPVGKAISPMIRAVETPFGHHWLFLITGDRVQPYKVTDSGIHQVQPMAGSSNVAVQISPSSPGIKAILHDADAVLTAHPGYPGSVVTLALTDRSTMSVPGGSGQHDLLVLRFDAQTGQLWVAGSEGHSIQPSICAPPGYPQLLRGCALSRDGMGVFVTGERPNVDCTAFTPFMEHVALGTGVRTDLTYAFPQPVDPKWVRCRIYWNTHPNGIGDAIYFPSSNGVGVLEGLGNLNSVSFDPNLFQNVTLPDFEEYAPWPQHAMFPFLDPGLVHDSYLTVDKREACCAFLARFDPYVVNGYEVTTNMVWTPNNNLCASTGTLTFFGDLVIQPGARLTVYDMILRFGPDSRIIVEPGGMLQMHRSLATSLDCDGLRWPGVEVRGTPGAGQFGNPQPTHQGKLELFASTVQNAFIGALVAGRTDDGSIDLGLTGGVVRAFPEVVNDALVPSSFHNCQRGVFFLPYQNQLPNGTHTGNQSRFSDVVFTVDGNYPGSFDFQAHAVLWAVDGLQFTACSFRNDQPDYFFGPGAYYGSQYLGYGIQSMDAHFVVGSGCDIVPPRGEACPDEDTRWAEFVGLDHGIHAATGTTGRNFTADRVRFINNIAGVYANKVDAYKVVNSHFSIGGRNVTLTNDLEHPAWEQRHRGLFSTESSGMIVDDNLLELDPNAAPGRLTEGIVIGYSRGHNDMVFRNTAKNLERGFIGEGVCADEAEKATKGLIFQCNVNQNNGTNIRSRLVPDPQTLDQHQTIRTNQGSHSRVADNEFDQLATGMDFVNDGWQYNVIAYHYAAPQLPYMPIYISQGVGVVGTDIFGQPHVRPANNCANRHVLPVIGDPETPSGLMAILTTEKEAYGNTRYLYDQLIDGGSTDEVVQEIMASWPQDAWDLRAYLLARSPYLTVDALKAAMDRPTMPAAMKAEICIANPDATKRDGFIRWLETECKYPLGETLVATIVASWNARTYRTTLEGALAHHHGEMTQAANMLIAHYTSDSTGFPVDSLRRVWQEVRTPIARYAEAALLMEKGEYNAATALVQAIPQEHPRLRPGQLTERDRMLAFIAFWEGVAQSGRSEAELDSAEVSQLEGLVNGAYDGPASRAQNILCFHYGKCRAPLTGGGEEAPKAMGQAAATTEAAMAQPRLSVYPNPATHWAALDYDLLGEPDRAMVVVRDAVGRPVDQLTVGSAQGQLVLDTRPLARGLYTVELINAGQVLHTEKLIVE